MIVKATAYFEIEKQEDAASVENELLIEQLSELLESHLSGDSFKLGGSSWSNSRIKATHVTRSEALDRLRKKS